MQENLNFIEIDTAKHTRLNPMLGKAQQQQVSE